MLVKEWISVFDSKSDEESAGFELLAEGSFLDLIILEKPTIEDMCDLIDTVGLI